MVINQVFPNGCFSKDDSGHSMHITRNLWKCRFKFLPKPKAWDGPRNLWFKKPFSNSDACSSERITELMVLKDGLAAETFLHMNVK